MRYLFLLALVACKGSGASEDSGTVVDTDTDTDADSDTDTDADADADTDADTDTDTDTDSGDSGASAGASYDWVMASLVVADRGDGFDLDGDGDVDNALAAAGNVLDPFIANIFSATAGVVVLQLWDVDSFDADASADLGMFPAVDIDGDTSDNFSGTEAFDASGQVDTSGKALVSTPVELTAGAYETMLATNSFSMGYYTLQSATPIYISGTADAASNDGLVGFGLSTETIALIAALAGMDTSTAEMLQGLADVDTDGDGEPDAVSGAFRFESVPCDAI